jgi:hypothetical protein
MRAQERPADLELAAWVADDVRRTSRGGRLAELRFEFDAASVARVWRALRVVGVSTLRASGGVSAETTVVRIGLSRAKLERAVSTCLAHGGRYVRPFLFPPMPA